MSTGKDGAGNTYFEVGNVRITCVEKTFNGKPGLRIQAYQTNGRLNTGPELPIATKTTRFPLLRAIVEATELIGKGYGFEGEE